MYTIERHVFMIENAHAALGNDLDWNMRANKHGSAYWLSYNI